MSGNVKQVANAAAPVVKRDVNKFLYRIREFLMLRKFTPNQRHEFEMVKRTQPHPLLPGGFAHKLFKNYYYERDARRQVGQPQVLFSSVADSQHLGSGAAQQQITAGGTTPTAAGATTPTAAGATTPQPGAATTSQTTAASGPLLTITEAEKHTASILAAVNNKQQKNQTINRTPGKIYNWDG